MKKFYIPLMIAIIAVLTLSRLLPEFSTMLRWQSVYGQEEGPPETPGNGIGEGPVSGGNSAAAGTVSGDGANAIAAISGISPGDCTAACQENLQRAAESLARAASICGCTVTIDSIVAGIPGFGIGVPGNLPAEQVADPANVDIDRIFTEGFPPGISACAFIASPSDGEAPLEVGFRVLYSAPGAAAFCRDPVVSWNAPCNPTTGCVYTYNSPGTFGPYDANVSFYSWVEMGGDIVERPPVCAETGRLSCRSTEIRVSSAPPPPPSPPPPSPPPPPPIIIRLEGQPASILRGQSSRMIWETENATSCNGSGVSGDYDDWNPSAPLPDPKPLDANGNGSETVTPTVTTVYRLTCLGPGGIASRDATISVGQVRWREILPRLFRLNVLFAGIQTGLR